MNISEESSESPTDIQQQDQKAGHDIIFVPPQCQPIGLAFSPISDTVDAATNHISDQTLTGLVSIGAKTTGNCIFNITSTIPTVVMVQPQVTIPAGFTTARVYGIFRSNTGNYTPSVYITATPATPTAPGTVTPPPVSARIKIPDTANSRTLTAAELAAISQIVEVQSISFPTPVTGGETPEGTVTLESIPTVDTIVYLSVNPDFQHYFSLPPTVTVPAHTKWVQVEATVTSPPDSFTMFVTAQSGDNFVYSNEITVDP